MAEAKKRQTFGTFNVTGFITIDDKTFTLNSEGKNNKNWISNVFNPKVETPEGKSMFMRFQDGFDKIKGKDIYARIKDSDQNLKLSFADRKNGTLLSQIDDKSFVRIALNKITKKNEETGKEYQEWNYINFITLYDAIAFLKEKFPIGTKIKVRLFGNESFRLYNGEISKNYDIQNFYLLDANDNSECEFKFTHDILIDQDSVDLSKWETDNVININGKVYQKKKKDVYEVLNIPFVMRPTDLTKKNTYDRLLQKFFTVENDTIRRIKVEGIYNVGYVASNVTESDLPEEAKELIEDGFYSKEEVLKMYANRDRVDELVIIRPHMIKDKTTQKPIVDYNDSEYTKEDLENLIVEPEKEEEVIIPEDSLDDDLMKELENL